MHVVHIAFECAPMYKTGGLGDVVGSLPKALEHLGIKASVIMPGYGFIKRLRYLPASRVPVFYIEDELFAKKNILQKHAVQPQAYARFCLGVVKHLEQLPKAPDIIHCHDWHAALIPWLLKKYANPFFAQTKTILTLHNIAYQGNFATETLDTPQTSLFFQNFKAQKRVSFLKQGIEACDYLTTVSANHKREILSGRTAFGLGSSVKKHKNSFVGIVNGLDYNIWNPARDRFVSPYTEESVVIGKAHNKARLQRLVGLEVIHELPLFGFVARLSNQKGFDLVEPLLTEFAQRQWQLVILGMGDKKYEANLAKIAKKLRGSISFNLGFDEDLAHQIYAAADFFLIPSHYEPCGLTQMISMAYGTVPIATAVGGLKDTIKNHKTGILFDAVTTRGLELALIQAFKIWTDRDALQKMIKDAMHEDFSWDKSAKKYAYLYKKVFTQKL